MESSDFPEGEYANAVMVSIDNRVDSLTGMNAAKAVKAEAVAYIPRLGMVSSSGVIMNRAPKISFKQGTLYADDDMNIQGANFSNDFFLFSRKNIMYQTATSFMGMWYTYGSSVKRSSSPSFPPSLIKLIQSNALPTSTDDPLRDYISKIKKRVGSDNIIGPLDFGDYVFEHDNTVSGGTVHTYSVDLTHIHDDHETIYFEADLKDGDDTPKDGDGRIIKVVLGAKSSSSSGKEIKNMTFVSNCPVIIPVYDSEIALGGDGMDQLIIVSSGEISFNTRNNPLNGVSFVCGSFTFEFNSQDLYQPPSTNLMNIITLGGNIEFQGNDTSNAKDYLFSPNFGPPCPMIVPAALGKLEKTADQS